MQQERSRRARRMGGHFTAHVGAYGCFVWLLLMCWRRIVWAHLWAEDGAVFLPQALRFGWRSLLLPEGGYFHLLPRLVAWFWSALPLQLFAYGVVLSSLGVTALVMGQFVDDAYAWLVPSRGLRLALCLAMCAVPGRNEVLGNLANLHYVLFVYVGLLAWRDCTSPYTRLQIVLLVVALGSEGAAVAWLPAFAWRAVHSWQRRPKATLRRELATCAAIVVSTWAHSSLAPGHGGQQLQAFFAANGYATTLTSALNLAIERFFYLPVGNTALVDYMRGHKRSSALLGASLILISASGVRRTGAGKCAMALVVVPLCALGLPLMTWIVRPGSMSSMLRDPNLLSSRYVFATGPFALVALVAALAALTAHRKITGRLIPLTLVGLQLLLALVSRWVPPLYGNEHHWWPTGSYLQRHCRSQKHPELSVPHNPSGWRIPCGSAVDVRLDGIQASGNE